MAAEKKTGSDLPKLAAPAQRALTGAGVTSLRHLSRFTEKEFASLHGIGKNAISTIKMAMKKEGIKFKYDLWASSF